MSDQMEPISSHEITIAPSLADKRVSVNLTPREAFDFVLKLSCDDEFRSRLEENPSEVLAEHHIYVPQELISGQLTLPPKERLQLALMDITLGREFRLSVASSMSPGFFWFFALFAAMPDPQPEI